ncbi:hypothetical protein ACFPRL_25035 [Pseudoclavibacter helvolus]
MREGSRRGRRRDRRPLRRCRTRCGTRRRGAMQPLAGLECRSGSGLVPAEASRSSGVLRVRTFVELLGLR